MRCETCHGTGYSCGPGCAAKLFSDHLPCPDCNGSGISHCCDGIQEQAPPSPPDGPCLGPIDDETARRIDEYNREQRDPKRELEELSAVAFAKCEETYVGPGRCDRSEYLRARYEYQVLMVKRGLLHPSEMDAQPAQEQPQPPEAREQRDPGDETADFMTATGVEARQLESCSAALGGLMSFAKFPAFHENPIIDALLTEASDDALETLWADQLGQNDVEWWEGMRLELQSPMQAALIAAEPTGCADDCCHPSHDHAVAYNAAVALYWAARTPAQERDAYHLCRALGMPPSYGEAPDTHDEWRSLNED